MKKELDDNNDLQYRQDMAPVNPAMSTTHSSKVIIDVAMIIRELSRFCVILYIIFYVG